MVIIMRLTILVVAMLAMVVLAGCAQKGTVTDNDIASVSEEISSIDEDAANTDTSDLDTLDQELAAIESLEIE
jgi:cytochrome oxidase Cu insertion factor (SCO1/SenC/PrrC family)